MSLPRKALRDIFPDSGQLTKARSDALRDARDVQSCLPALVPDDAADAGTCANRLDVTRIPGHIAVIMDGNGRWAKCQGKSRAAGHRAGISAVRELIRVANDIGIDYLTIYSFSTENWSRPPQEVRTLMGLFARTMNAELEGMLANHVRIRLIGDVQSLPPRTRRSFLAAVEKSAACTGMTLVIAVNYGARQEIVAAARHLTLAALRGEIDAASVKSFDTQDFSAYLSTAGIPDPDLLIRTSGECRLSNFLLYQIAYSEIYISELLWPDFDRYELLRALLEYQRRERRFGGVGGA